MTSQLILKCAALSRPSGEWDHDDHDVLEDGAVAGRTYRQPAVPARWQGCGRAATTAR
jgi:hypothetical protein